MHVQSVKKYCFSLSNMQICEVFVAVVVVVAKLPITAVCVLPVLILRWPKKKDLHVKFHFNDLFFV